jgi:hypothetical protein
MRFPLVMVTVIATVAACGDSETQPDAGSQCGTAGGGACFSLPTAPLSVPDGAADLACTPLVMTPAPTAVTVRGKVQGFGSGTPIPGADVKLFPTVEFATPLAETVADAEAKYSITLPQGTPDFMWGTVGGAGYLTTYVHAFRPDLSMGDISDFTLANFKPSNIEGAAILVKESWDPAYAVVAGFVRDCERRVVQHAALALSSTSGSRTFIANASLYYGAPGAVPLAVSHDERQDTNENGVFAVFRVPPGQMLFLQAWGFPDAAAQAKGEAGLVLFSEHPVHAVADSVVNINLWVNR